MADKKQQVLPPSHAQPPGVRAPVPSLPALPDSSGAVWGSPTTVMRKDTDYVAAHADFLRARTDQVTALRGLVLAREELALAISRLHALPERCQHEYEKGRLERLNELKLLQLQHQLAETNAEIHLAAARLQFSQYQPQPEAPPAPPQPVPSPAPTGLTPTDVRAVAQIMPEMKPETIEALVLAVTGFLAEKNK